MRTLLGVIVLIGMLGQSVFSQVTMRDSTISWNTYDYELNDDYTLASYSLDPDDIVDTTFSVKIIENEYLRIMLLPEYGGRIISMIYKPTGHEQLYQNPVGTPYGWWFTGTFYYNWLMLFGGIFPTLPEPEHGKSWLMPWDFEVVTQTADSITVKMSWTDDLEYNQYARYGDSDIQMDFFVSIYSGSSALHTEVELTNNGDSQQNFEYWTNASLAPGSTSGLYNSRVNGQAKLIIPAEKLKIPSWTQLLNTNSNVEESVPGERDTYYFEALRDFSNWEGSGSAFTRPELTENYWGVINGENNEGLIRISDNAETPYVKIWTFGYPTSKDIDPFDPDPSLTSDNGSDLYYYRPFIELWGGVSSEFNVPDAFVANSTRSWSEVYIPTIGLANVTDASEELVADFAFNDFEDKLTLNLYSSVPGKEMNLSFLSQGLPNSDTTFISNEMGNVFEFSIAGLNEDEFSFEVSGTNNQLVLDGDIQVVNTSNEFESENEPHSISLLRNYPNPFNPTTTISYNLENSGMVSLEVYDLVGRKISTLINEHQSLGSHSVHFNASGLSSGIYLVRLRAGDQVAIRKITLLK